MDIHYFKRSNMMAFVPCLAGVLAMSPAFIAAEADEKAKEPEKPLRLYVYETELVIRGVPKATASVKFSSDGQYLASVDATIFPSQRADCFLRLWDASTGEEFGRVKAHSHGTLGFEFSPDGKTVATVGLEQPFGFTEESKKVTFRLWAYPHEKGKPFRGLAKEPVREGESFTFRPDGTRVKVRVEDTTARAIEYPSGEELSKITDYPSDPMALAFSKKGDKMFIVGSQSLTWHLPTGKTEVNQLPVRLDKRFDAPKALAMTPDGKYLAAGFGGNVSDFFKAHAPGRHKLGWREYATRLGIEEGSAGHVQVWNVEKGEELFLVRGHDRPVREVNFSPDRRVVASSDEAGLIRFWELQTGRAMGYYRPNSPGRWAWAFSPDGETIAIQGTGGEIRLWKLSR